MPGFRSAKSDCQPAIERYTFFMKALLLLAAILLIGGCATERTVLVNSAGDRLTCETTGGGIFGAAATGYEQNYCITQAEQRGYFRQN